MNATTQKIAAPIIRRVTILRFRGIEELVWLPDPSVNVILGGGDVGKSTILDAIALLLSANNPTGISDVDFWRRDTQPGFEVEAVMTLPEASGINRQSKQAWPWHWDGSGPSVPNMDGESGDVTDPVYIVKVRVNADFEVTYEIVQPDDSVENFNVAIRRSIGLVRLGGDDRNDRDLRLVQGSALDRLLSDRTLRARLGAILAARDVGQELKDDGKEKLKQLDAAFEKQTLPHQLALGLTGGQGFSIGALIGVTADKDKVQLPLASWGAGTRRLASLEIAAACQGDCPITLVDEIERGLEPYRQRILITRLQEGPSQVFLTTHSGAAIGAAHKATVWYLDAKGTVGRLPRAKISRQQMRDPETFLARLTVAAEGETEKGFARWLLERTLPGALHERGIWLTECEGHDSALDLLEALAEGGLQFGGFVDNEGRHPQRWQNLKAKLGSLLFQWRSGCLEENIIKHVPDDKLQALIEDPSGDRTGERLRTLADRLDMTDKSFDAIKVKAPDLRALIIDAACGRIPSEKATAPDSEKKALRSHAKVWFKSFDGGRELAEKMVSLRAWPSVKDQLLPFVNAVRGVDRLNELADLP
ncbi:MAG: AAA family ATPase [Hyphomicrobiales bacterium]|nr:AAA family ATPase [Hyphomicrobiales bacterium]